MKCSNCGRIFSYEKFYGICPKCGMYNRRQEDMEGDQPKDAVQEEKPKDAFQGENPMYTFVEDGRASEEKTPGRSAGKSAGKSAVGIGFAVVCTVLIVTSLIGIIGMEKMTNAKIKRDVLLTDFDAGMGTFGEPFGIGEHKITVDGVRLLQPADTKTEFPAGEACIAVHVKVQNGGEYSSSAPSLEMPYIGYTDQTGHRVYKNTIGKYDFDLYEEHYQVRLMESYDYRYEVNAEGDFIYFVDAGADSAILCFEERSHEKGELEQLIALCEVEIPLPKEVGE